MRTIINHASASCTVSVNQTIIAGADIAREVQNRAGANAQQAWEAATRALVVRELLLQRARSLGLVAKPRSQGGLRETDEEALTRQLLETELKTPTADEAACHHYYRANQGRFRGPDLYEPLHILFKTPYDDEAAYAQAIERAEAALEQLRAAPDQFESLARAVRLSVRVGGGPSRPSHGWLHDPRVRGGATVHAARLHPPRAGADAVRRACRAA